MGRGGVEQLTYDQLLTSTYTTVSIIIQLLIFMYSVYERAKTFQVRIWRESQSPYHLKKTYFLKFTLWFTTNIPRSVISKHKYHSDIPSFEKNPLDLSRAFRQRTQFFIPLTYYVFLCLERGRDDIKF